MSDSAVAAAAASSSSATGAAAANSETIDLEELLSVCVELAGHAGASIRRIFDSGKLNATEKDETAAAAGGSAPCETSKIIDPQTAADLESQRIIIGNLVRLWPSLRIVGEEGELDNAIGGGGRVEVERQNGNSVAKQAGVEFPKHLRAVPMKDVAVWVDPLDGTKEFTLGFVHYVTVLIGVSVSGRAVGGVVHVPFTGGKYQRKHDPLNQETEEEKRISAEKEAKEAALPPGKTVWGAVGAGVHGMTVPSIDTIKPHPRQRRFVTTTRTHFSPALSTLLEGMHPGRVIRCGGAGSKGLLVLSREADAYVFPQRGTKLWDSAAIDALVRAAGGRFTDQHGHELLYDPARKSYANEKGMLATLQDHDLYILPETTKATDPAADAAKAKQKAEEAEATAKAKANL